MLGIAALALAGCSDRDRVKTAAETDEPAYREGQSQLKAGRRQEALSAFLKVIDQRGDDAPESHLEVGRPPYGVMFQSGALFGSMTVGENLALPLGQWTELPTEARSGTAPVQ